MINFSLTICSRFTSIYGLCDTVDNLSLYRATALPMQGMSEFFLLLCLIATFSLFLICYLFLFSCRQYFTNAVHIAEERPSIQPLCVDRAMIVV